MQSLQSKCVLLIFDDCDGLEGPDASTEWGELLSAIVTSSRRVHAIATSREYRAIEHGTELQVHPMQAVLRGASAAAAGRLTQSRWVPIAAGEPVANGRSKGAAAVVAASLRCAQDQ